MKKNKEFFFRKSIFSLNEISIFIIMIFLFCTSMFGRQFLILKFRPFFLLFIYSLLFIYMKFDFFKSAYKKNILFKLWLTVFIYANLYVLLSYFSVFTNSNIQMLQELSFVPRHSYFIYYGFFIGSMIYYLILNWEISWFSKKIRAVAAFLFVVHLIFYHNNYYLFIFLMMVTYKLLLKRKFMYFSILFCIGVFWGRVSNGTGSLLLIIFIFFFVAGDYLIRSIKYWWIYLFIFSFSYIMIFSNMGYVKSHDGNTWWRLASWKSNMQTLIKINLIGFFVSAQAFRIFKVPFTLIL